MTTSEVIPVDFLDPLNAHIAKGEIPTKYAERKSASLSLEVVKGIWRKYPTLPETKKVGTVAVVQSNSQRSNVLELNLGVQRENEAPNESPTIMIPMTNIKPSSQAAGSNEQGPGAPVATSVQLESPASERAVDDLLPIVSDSIDTSPAFRTESLPLAGSSQPSPRGDKMMEERSHVLHSSSSSTSAKLQYNSGTHSIREVRSTLMDPMVKAIHHCHPNLVIDHEKLGERFSQKLSDSEVRHFMQLGKDVLQQLKGTGKLEDVKRKYMTEGDEDRQRRIRRRLDSTSPRPVGVPHESRQSVAQGPGSTLSPGDSRRSTHVVPSHVPRAMVSGKLNHNPLPRAPRAMLSNSWKDIPAVPPSHQSLAVSRDRVTLQPHEFDRGSLSPGQIPDDENMSISETSRPVSLSPRATRISSATSTIVQVRVDRPTEPIPGETLGPSHTNQADGQAELNNHLPNSGAARILLAKIGLPSVGMLNASFDLDEQLVAAIRRWAERSKHFDPSELSMKLYLMSIPTFAAENARRECPPDAPPSFLANAVSQISVAWPQPGTLSVLLNEDHPGAVSWTEHFFGPSSPALDLSGVVVEGKNNIQFVQFGDHSQTLFVVLAVPPSDSEHQEALGLHSRRKVWVQLTENYRNHTHVKLQFGMSIQDEVV